MQTDQSLLDAVVAEEAGAQAEFVARYRRLTVGLAIRRFGFSESEGEEIFQELVLRLWRNDFRALRAWRGQGRLSSYLAVVVGRLCAKRVRERRHRRSIHDAGSLAEGGPSGPSTTPSATSPEASARLLAEERRAAVVDALRQLRSQQRLVLLLRYERGLSPSAIGDLLSLRSGTVRKRLHDARRSMRRFLLRRYGGVFDQGRLRQARQRMRGSESLEAESPAVEENVQ